MAIRNDPRARTTAPPVRAGSPAASSGGRGAPLPRRRPDPRPMRLALAAGGAAALSGLLAVIGGSALPTAAATPATATDPTAGGAGDVAPVQHIVRYVFLAPGQQPPSGTLAQPGVSQQGTVAVPVAPPKAQQAAPRIRTSQSGAP